MSLWSLLGIAVFLAVVFIRDIPVRMANGDNGRVAIAVLDEVRRPFLGIFAAEARLLNEGYSESVRASLEEAIERGQDLIAQFKQAVQYSPAVLQRVERLDESFESWIEGERAMFAHYAGTKPGPQTAADDQEAHRLLALTSAAFSRTMERLAEGEGPIHHDIDGGSRAVRELTLLGGLLMAFLLGGVYYLQWSHNRVLRGLLAEVEQRVRERTAELRASQEELVRKQRLAAIGQLTATVSHELRNPLGSIRNALAVIRRLPCDDNPMMQNAMDIAERGIGRCDNIITELLDFTRVRELRPETTDIDAWLAGALDDYECPPGIELARELNSGAELACDRDCLLRAILNVLDNACDAVVAEAENGNQAFSPRLTVTTRVAGEWVEILVADNGAGIAADHLEKIFEPLFSTKSFGVGLGMPVVRQVMEQHGGGVQVHSEPGRGTRVRLWLPLHTEEGKG